jgi:hypothetical protein
VAPDAELFPVKINFANTTAAFNAAVGLAPAIITCSWGSDVRTRVALAAGDSMLIHGGVLPHRVPACGRRARASSR